MQRRAMLGALLATPAVAVAADSPGPKRYFVLFHTPGAKWDRSKHFRDQPGIDQHVGYMSGFADKGKLAFGGPFLDDSGGMMVLDVATAEEAQTIATGDPTVKSGLLSVTVKPWLMALQRS